MRRVYGPAEAGHYAGVVAITCALVAGASAQEPVASSPMPLRTVWDGVYNSAQAERGGAAYGVHCASCHRDDLSGYDGLLRGRRFMDKYREASLDLLFEKTKTTMPRNAAGSLTDQTYVDILSFVLHTNEFPAGADELRVEDVTRVMLTGKEGPAPVPNFSLVQVVGCVGRREDEWLLTRATEPVRTGLPQPGPGELNRLKPVSGDSSYSLMMSLAYAPANHLGRIAEVRGFLIRRPNGDRINVTSLETLGSACAQ